MSVIVVMVVVGAGDKIFVHNICPLCTSTYIIFLTIYSYTITIIAATT